MIYSPFIIFRAVLCASNADPRAQHAHVQSDRPARVPQGLLCPCERATVWLQGNRQCATVVRRSMNHIADKGTCCSIKYVAGNMQHASAPRPMCQSMQRARKILNATSQQCRACAQGARCSMRDHRHAACAALDSAFLSYR